MKRNINIALIADEGYLIPTCVAITSIIENRDKDYFYNIYVVMPEEIPEHIIETIKASENATEGVKVIVKKINMDELRGLHNDNEQKYLAATETALLKFKLPKIFPEIDRLLYLDGDILVMDSLVELYECDMKGKALAAVRDLPQVLYDKQVIGKDINGQEYFNSGVMLLDLAKMRTNNRMDELIEVKRNLNDCSLMDQNVFNIVFREDMLQLPFLYNVCYINLMESANRYRIEKLNNLYNTHYSHPSEIINDIKIVHFSSKLKPWLFYDVPLADRWIYYYKKSVLGNVPLQRVWHTKRNVDMNEIKEQVKILSNDEFEEKKVVPIVFATNKEYAPYVAVAIQSIYECSTEEYFYDINILIDASMTKNLLEKFKKLSYKNMTVRLWDVRKCFEGVNLYSVGHYSRQMYFRWLIPEIFSKYDKVLYLDCDLVVQRDIGELYEINIHDNYIGAINNFLRNNLENYVKNRLGLSINQYYNSGVLLINTREWILNDIKNRCLMLLREKDKLACPDQDVINIACKGKVSKIDDKWNFQWHHQFKDACKGDFTDNYEERYKKVLKEGPSIIHYTSFMKPWNNPERIYAEVFWKYCRNTFFYEDILWGNLLNQTQKLIEANKGVEQNNIVSSKSVEQNIYENKDIMEEVIHLRYELTEIRKSKSYRIGHFITLIPRWIRHILFQKPM